MLKMVLSTHFEAYEKGEVLRDAGQSLFGTGVFNSDGPYFKLTHRPIPIDLYRVPHRGYVEVRIPATQPFQFPSCTALGRFHRSLTRPFFNKDRISDFDIFDRHADQVISKLKARFKEGIAVDVQDVLSRFTLDTATDFLFGQDVKTLSADLPYPSTYRGPNRRREHPSDRFALAIDRAMEYTLPRVIYGEFWRLMEFWKDTVATQRGITHELIDPIIHGALERRNVAKELDEVQGEGTLLDHLVQQTDGGSQLIQQSDFGLKSRPQISTSSETKSSISWLRVEIQ